MTDQSPIQTALPPPGAKMSASEYFDLPETMTRIELINGQIVYSFGYNNEGETDMHPPPGINHQHIVGNTYVHLRTQVESGRVYVSPVAFHLDDEHVVEPDVAWIAPQSNCRTVDGKHFRGSPALAVEVLSPGTARRDKTEKLLLYQRHGTREYWLVDENTTTVDVRLRDGAVLKPFGVFGVDDTFQSPTLGIPITVAVLFEGLE